VLVSPSLVAHLDGLGRVPGVRCLWLASWSSEMRAHMSPFSGRTWPALRWEDVVPAGMARRRRWWKLSVSVVGEYCAEAGWTCLASHCLTVFVVGVGLSALRIWRPTGKDGKPRDA
jgi:hypothetical protein